ncbi:MAG: hypothetical protein ACPF9D_08440, partial [Owenweeksia sp.]
LNQSEFWELPNNEKYIVLGHSHPECAYNDSLIPDFANLGSSGEAYLYSYVKLQKIIENNPQLKTVFIEYGTNNIDEVMSLWTWDDIHVSNNLPKYFAIIDKEEMGVLWENNSRSVLTIPPKTYIEEIGYNYYNSIFKENNFMSSRKRYGGYLHLVRDKTDSLIVARKPPKKHSEKPKDRKVSDINIYYLGKMLELCEQNEVQACLVRSPVHEFYSNPSKEEAYQNILRKNFPEATLLDFEKFPLENNQYGDFGHINHKGAEVFSRWFAELLNNGLLEKEDKQKFIDEAIEARVHNGEQK